MPIFQTPTNDILFGKAPIDWCEENHPESNPWHWQELHNTWTNAAYVMVGITLAAAHMKQKCPTDPLFLLACFAGIMTGVTSAWFHATLIYIAQKSDEFFENAMIVAMTYCMMFPLVQPSSKTPPSKGATRYLTCLTHMALLAFGTVFIPEDFAEIHLVMAVLTFFWKVTERTNLVLDPKVQEKSRFYRNWAFLSAIGAFALWGVDRAHCTPFVQSLNLHAFAWHWGTALALLLGSVSVMLVLDSHWMQSMSMKCVS